MDVADARERVLADHGQLLREILGCADAVAAGWPASGRADGDAVAAALAAALDRANITERLPRILADAVAAAGGSLAAEPVAAPPYVTVTSVGPVLRATLTDGRLVLTVRAFRVERHPVRYVRGPASIESALSVTGRRRPDTL